MPKRGQFQAAGCWIAPVTRLAHYIRCDFTCQACGRELRDDNPRMLSLDHLIPRSKGGTNAAHNLILVCTPCNAARGNKRWREAYPGGSHARIKRVIRRRLNRSLARSLMEGRRDDRTTAVEDRDLPAGTDAPDIHNESDGTDGTDGYGEGSRLHAPSPTLARVSAESIDRETGVAYGIVCGQCGRYDAVQQSDACPDCYPELQNSGVHPIGA